MFLLMIRRPPRSTRTEPPFPSPPLFRSRAGEPNLVRAGQLQVRNGCRNSGYAFHARDPFTRQHHLIRRAKTREWKRSEEHTSELQSLMRISYAVFCLKKKKLRYNIRNTTS